MKKEEEKQKEEKREAKKMDDRTWPIIVKSLPCECFVSLPAG